MFMTTYVNVIVFCARSGIFSFSSSVIQHIRTEHPCSCVAALPGAGDGNSESQVEMFSTLTPDEFISLRKHRSQLCKNTVSETLPLSLKCCFDI